jgi:hypothetical protein
MAETKPLKIDEDKFNAVLKKMIEHKPAPKRTIRASRKNKFGKVVGEAPHR